MGNHHSYRNINKGDGILNDMNTHMKIKQSSKQPFFNPDNRVLPVVSSGQQILRSTNNGNILQSGGTISGRKSHYLLQTNNGSEFIQYLQKKSPAVQSFTINEHFPQSTLGHKKSHSDPDIVRKIMEENETEDTDGAFKYESECSTTHHSRIALSPSKAKIRSRKKKKAPEPPKPNTLPRTMNGRNKFRQNAQEFDDVKNKRPLPPIPLDDFPKLPPSDYNKFVQGNHSPETYRSSLEKELLENSNLTQSKDRTEFRRPARIYPGLAPETDLPVYHYLSNFLETSSFSLNNSASSRDIPSTIKCFQKNHKNLNQRKQIKTDNALEPYQKSKSLETLRLRELDDNREGHRFIKACSFRNATINYCEAISNIEQSKILLNDGIIEAARGRMERMNRNPSFKSSMNLSDDDEPQKDKCKCKSNQLNGFERNIENFSTNAAESSEHQSHTAENEQQGRRFQSSIGISGNSSDPKSFDFIYQRAKTNGYGDQCMENTRNGNIDRDKAIHALRTCENENDRCHMKTYGEELKKPLSLPPVYESDGRVHNEYNLRKSGINNPFLVTGDDFFKNKPNGNNNCRSTNAKKEYHDYRYYSSPKKGSKADYQYKYLDSKVSSNECFLKCSSDPRGIYRKDYQPINCQGVIGTGAKNNTKAEYEIFSELSKDNSILSVLPTSLISDSSNSDEELDIKLQLRPTLPRRPINKFRFSPIQVWKSINPDLSKEFSRSDISTDDGDDILEDKVHRIQKAVAPRRILYDRSGDSGISPGAGSPIFVGEYLPTTNELCSTYPNDSAHAIWIPQQDIEDSDCGSGSFMQESNLQQDTKSLQPKLTLTNLIFPSRSFPRTNHKIFLDGKDTLGEAEKSRFKSRRKRQHKSSDTQHFNSLKNLKRALGLRTNESTAQKTNCLDTNWSLTRSLPNMEILNRREFYKSTKEFSKIDYSNSEHQDTDIDTTHNVQYINFSRQKSFSAHNKDGHVMYLPEYHSVTVPSHLNGQTNPFNAHNHANVNNTNFFQRVPINEQTEKQNKFKKMFSYQNTLKKLEKKRLEEKLAKEIELKEKEREQEIEWMNKVEEEFRKQRLTEKSDVKKRLRMFSLLERRNKNFDNCTSESNEDEFETQNIYNETTYQADVSSDAEISKQNLRKDSKPRTSENNILLKSNSNIMTTVVRNTKEKNKHGRGHFAGKLCLRLQDLNPKMYISQEGFEQETFQNKVPLQEIEYNSYSNVQQFKDTKLMDIINFVETNGQNGYNQTENMSRVQEINGEIPLNMKMQLKIAENITCHDTQQTFDKTDEEVQLKKIHPSQLLKNGEAKENELLNQADRTQQTGMKKWLRQPNRYPLSHKKIPRPEPEGSRSFRDCVVDGMEKDATQQVVVSEKNNLRCSHGNEYPCRNCFLYESQSRYFSREGASGRLKRLKTEVNKEIQAKVQKSGSQSTTKGSPSTLPSFPNGFNKHKVQTNPCWTNSRQALGFKSPYGYEARRDTDFETLQKGDSTNLTTRSFNPSSFESELNTNVRKKSIDFEKSSQKSEMNDQDSDDSQSEKKENNFRRHLTRIQKKPDQRNPLFTRNHPLRRVKHQSSTSSIQTTKVLINDYTDNVGE